MVRMSTGPVCSLRASASIARTPYVDLVESFSVDLTWRESGVFRIITDWHAFLENRDIPA